MRQCPWASLNPLFRPSPFQVGGSFRSRSGHDRGSDVCGSQRGSFARLGLGRTKVKKEFPVRQIPPADGVKISRIAKWAVLAALTIDSNDAAEAVETLQNGPAPKIRLCGSAEFSSTKAPTSATRLIAAPMIPSAKSKERVAAGPVSRRRPGAPSTGTRPQLNHPIAITTRMNKRMSAMPGREYRSAARNCLHTSRF
jgi:hypothetical protein